MFKRNRIVVTLLAVASTGALHAQSPDLPPGPIEAKVRTACTECHESRIIVQQRLGKPAWTKEVDKMIKWGAVVDATDRDAFIDYLTASFSPDKSAYIAETTMAGKTTRDKAK